ncbi:MAG: CarD family transcriptional regulator, partial [Bacteroidales bacterium]|nr:CarD family transcriptional regulator [Bacteroidales bacterium]
MEIAELQKLYATHRGLTELTGLLRRQSADNVFLGGLTASSLPVLFAALWRQLQCRMAFVLSDEEEAGYFYHDLTQLMGDDDVLFFPSPFKRKTKDAKHDAANEILRTEALNRLQSSQPVYVVTYPDAVAEKVVSAQSLAQHTLALHKGERMALDEFDHRLQALGFVQVDYVYEPGQYARRGSIVDVFSYSSELPYRIDFFGDEIESLRTFEVDSQLSQTKLEQIDVVPSLTSEDADFLDSLPADTFVVHRTSTVLEGVHNRVIVFGNKPSSSVGAYVQFHTAAQPVFHKNFDMVGESFARYMQEGYALYICTDSLKQAARLRSIFEERGDDIVFEAVGKTLHAGFCDHDLKCCFFTDHQIFDRFHKYSLRSDKARIGKMALTMKELNQFEIGDYVVHIDHGIGRFGGLVRIPNGDSTQEVIKLIYQHEDVVFVSIHALHKLSKYKGREGEAPRISKLGTGAWERIKERTKTKIKDIARDLIRLYSLRKKEAGFSFAKDGYMQHELEASFIYEDTPDQLKATQDVKADMESPRPMDRLVCGDVGFGKTEVAIRAAFKAATDGKQVAVLVPTTVLAFQHWQTFSERLHDFPCKVDYLSRARSATDTKRILEELGSGKIDIIIGTHKLIGKSVKFKDLGLLIVDEEQKFGVGVKEKLRQLKVNVDTLTLTATPIPRTLQFSLLGARDLSVIQTPPPNRYPIQTEVHTFDEDVIVDAINFEMGRNGQVFFVNNRVQNLESLRAMIVNRIPDCRVCIGHGQMSPVELEKIVYDFVNFDYDVFVATTIVENGIDMPNVNTIIVNQAHCYGLSDLHQLRGRVGRSNRKAFCYLLAPPFDALTPEAKRRLEAIENFSDLGSGIYIAMQDLDIRGAGNLLGAEQSGFIADLGYETYQKILEEAVQELREDEFPDVLPDAESARNVGVSGERYVSECTVESDLELL